MTSEQLRCIVRPHLSLGDRLADPLISVVIPCYNASGYLRDGVESVMTQPVDSEIILVDDGSTDSTAAIVDLRLDQQLAVH